MPNLNALADEVEGLSGRVEAFEKAVAAFPWLVERLEARQQFNCYETADPDADDDFPDDHREFSLCIGPITNARALPMPDVEGPAMSDLLEAAFKLASDTARALSRLQGEG